MRCDARNKAKAVLPRKEKKERKKERKLIRSREWEDGKMGKWRMANGNG